jgi:hypothetical protein
MRTSMTPAEVLLVARSVAERQAWPWIEPIEVVQARSFPLLGKRYWRVRTNSKSGIRSVHLRIEDATGRVLRAGYVPY